MCGIVRTATGYIHVEGSGDEAGKSACLNTTDKIAIQQGQISIVARAHARPLTASIGTAVALL